MFYKKILFFQLFFCIHVHAIDSWISIYISPLSLTEQELVLDVVKAAIKRSEATIKTQKTAEKLVTFIQNETNFIAKTRLHPAQCTNETNVSVEIMAEWMQQKAIYISTCTEYDQAVSLIEAQPLLFSAFNAMRKDARKAVLKSTAAESYRLKDLAATLSEYGQKTFNSVQLLQTLVGKRSMIDDMVQWITSLLIMPFNQCDEQLTTINDQSWQLVQKQFSFGNYVWHLIEETRLNVYHSYYYALIVHLKKSKDTIHEI